MFRFKHWDRKRNTGLTGLATVAAVFLVSLLSHAKVFAEAPFEFNHPVANQTYNTLPIPLQISRRPGTAVPDTEAIDVHFEIRQWPHPYGFATPVRNAIMPGDTDHAARLVYFWTTTPGTYSIRARADGFKDHPVEITFTTTFTLERPLYRIVKPDNRIYQGAKVPLVVDWDPFWATVAHRPYGTLYAEVESWDEGKQAWRPEWRSGNLTGFQLPIVLPEHFPMGIQVPGKPTAKRVRVRPSFSPKAYARPSGWRYFCHAHNGKINVGPAQDRKPCKNISVDAGSPADLKGKSHPIPGPPTGPGRKQVN